MSAPGGWRLRNVPFRLALADLSLGAPRLPLVVRHMPGDAQALTGQDLPALARSTDAPLDGEAMGRMLVAHPVAETLPSLRLAGARLVYVPRQYPLYAIDLTMGFEAYQAKFSSKSRSSLRRKVKRFAERSGGRGVWQQYATPHELEAFRAIARALSARTYQERRLDAGLPASDAFREEMLARAAEGRARGYLLFLDGAAIAYLYCPIDDGVLSYAHVGYDPAFADLSPGTVLQWHVLEALFAEKRHRVFDFTQGEGDHKRFFATEVRQCANVVILAPSLRGWSVVLAQFLLDRMSGLAGRALDRLGLKRAIRRLLRR